jgi:DNA mismatch endonuclease (patch repair protein)
MADIFNPKKRSEIMSLIKAKNTKPEILVFKYLRANNIYFQKHYKSKEKINIDIAQPRKRKALFIDGEFWHGYTLERRKDKLPMFWVQKIIRNVKRDRRYRAGDRNEGALAFFGAE